MWKSFSGNTESFISDLNIFRCSVQMPVQILALFIHIGNAVCARSWSLEELLDAAEPVDKSHEGGEKAGAKETDGHAHHKLGLIHVPYDVLLWKHRNGGIAEDLDGGDS